MSLKDDLKDAGSGAGRTLSGFCRSVGLTFRAAADKVNGADAEKERGTEEGPGLKQSWAEVGRDLGQTGLSLGKVIVGAARKAAGAAYNGLERAERFIENRRTH